MPSYRISFINEIARGAHVFRCVQRSILIHAARDRDRAVEAAKRRFARLEGIRHWSHHAGAIEVEPAEPNAETQRPENEESASGKP
jgi:hypothetical protein